MSAEALFHLAQSKLRPLTEPEWHLISCVASGKTWRRQSNKLMMDDPALGASWGPRHLLGADLIAWLCREPEAQDYMSKVGIQVIGARIEETLQLQDADFGNHLNFSFCSLEGGLTCAGAHFASLNFSGSHLGMFFGDWMEVSGNVFMGNGFTANGEVRLPLAKIGGDFRCEGGRFLNEGDKALWGGGLKVSGSVLFRTGFEAKGAVQLPNLRVGKNIDCRGGSFDNGNEVALNLQSAKVARNIFLCAGFESKGIVSLAGAEIAGTLLCDKGKFENIHGVALLADGMKVTRHVSFCNGFKAIGEVRLLDAVIGGDLQCDDGKFLNQGGKALNAENLNVKENLIMRHGFNTEGTVHLTGAKIGGDFIHLESFLEEEDSNMIVTEGIEVAGKRIFAK